MGRFLPQRVRCHSVGGPPGPDHDPDLRSEGNSDPVFGCAQWPTAESQQEDFFRIDARSQDVFPALQDVVGSKTGFKAYEFISRMLGGIVPG